MLGPGLAHKSLITHTCGKYHPQNGVLHTGTRGLKIFSFWRRLGGSVEDFGNRRTRDQTLEEHDDALDELKRQLQQPDFTALPGIMPSRPARFTRPPALDSCEPILIDELYTQCGATFHRRALLGTLIADTIKMSSVQSLLEDKAGDVITVGVTTSALNWVYP